MTAFLESWYEWILAAHIVAIIAWMAGMLYLPRLFVYHTRVAAGSEASELFKVMEHRLLKAIINPSMIVAWILGILLLWRGDFAFLGQGWMHGKLVLALAMTGVHGIFVGHVRNFAHDRNEKPEKFFRILNEVPTVLMIAIVFLVVLGTR